MAVWRRHLRPGDLFLDVGANVGVYSILTSELGARVVAVEPDPPSITRLRENLDLNDLGTVVVLPVALGSASGTAALVSNDVFSRIGSGPDCVDVAVTTLDEVLGDGYAAGVKIDVEGFERQVLEGAGRALAEHRIGLLQLECNAAGTGGEPDSAVFEILRRHGYDVYRPTDDGGLVPLHGRLYKNLFAADMRTGAALGIAEIPVPMTESAPRSFGQ